ERSAESPRRIFSGLRRLQGHAGARVPRLSAAPKPEGDAGRDHRHAEPLAHAHAEGEQTEEAVGLAEEFGDEAQHTVADEKRARHLAEAARLLAVGPEHDEEKDAFEREFVELRRMARQRRSRLRKDHRPRQLRAREAAPQFAVDEVSDAPGGKPGRYARRDEVGHFEKVALARTGENRHRRDHAEQAAVKGHAAFPDREDLERMRGIEARLVEEHVAEAAADHGAENSVEKEVFDVAARPAGGCELRQLRAAHGEKEEKSEADQVCEPVPVNGDRHAEPRKVERDRIELRMNKHATMIRAALRVGPRRIVLRDPCTPRLRCRSPAAPTTSPKALPARRTVPCTTPSATRRAISANR